MTPRRFRRPASPAAAPTRSGVAAAPLVPAVSTAVALETPVSADAPAGRPTRRASVIEPVPLEQLPDVMSDEHVRLALGLSRDQWERHITKANRRGSGYTLPAQIPVKPRRYLKADVVDWMHTRGAGRFRRAS